VEGKLGNGLWILSQYSLPDRLDARNELEQLEELLCEVALCFEVPDVLELAHEDFYASDSLHRALFGQHLSQYLSHLQLLDHSGLALRLVGQGLHSILSGLSVDACQSVGDLHWRQRLGRLVFDVGNLIAVRISLSANLGPPNLLVDQFNWQLHVHQVLSN